MRYCFMNVYEKRALLIYNPLSGKKKKHKYFPILLRRLSEMGYLLSIHELDELKQAENPIQKACRQKWDAVFIAGGDGTVNQVIQFLAEEACRPKVGIFPFGTSNEFAKFIGMPPHVLKALSAIESGSVKPVDIGKIGHRYFVNIAAAGWLTNITYETSPRLKSKLGELAYCLYFVKAFLKGHTHHRISVRTEDDQVISDLSLFLIMNGNSVGPINKLFNGPAHDGHFYLVAYKKTGRIRLLAALLKKLLFSQKKVSIIQYHPIKAADFSMTVWNPFNLDGERADIKDLHFQVMPKHLQVFSTFPRR
ncbi:YegS/Rv2252/BmrU family lipid kinase [Bacillus swezeyi]|uniref:diacylglycerol/lipid kinase family protein n=2 Tax=Bacillus swezeyi TaxID=1925020 RepID=UPI0039C5AD51